MNARNSHLQAPSSLIANQRHGLTDLGKIVGQDGVRPNRFATRHTLLIFLVPPLATNHFAPATISFASLTPLIASGA